MMRIEGERRTWARKEAMDKGVRMGPGRGRREGTRGTRLGRHSGCGS